MSGGLVLPRVPFEDALVDAGVDRAELREYARVQTLTRRLQGFGPKHAREIALYLRCREIAPNFQLIVHAQRMDCDPDQSLLRWMCTIGKLEYGCQVLVRLSKQEDCVKTLGHLLLQAHASIWRVAAGRNE